MPGPNRPTSRKGGASRPVEVKEEDEHLDEHEDLDDDYVPLEEEEEEWRDEVDPEEAPHGEGEEEEWQNSPSQEPHDDQVPWTPASDEEEEEEFEEPNWEEFWVPRRWGAEMVPALYPEREGGPLWTFRKAPPRMDPRKCVALPAHMYYRHVGKGPHWNYCNLDDGQPGIVIPPRTVDLEMWADQWIREEPMARTYAPWRTSVVTYRNGSTWFVRSGSAHGPLSEDGNTPCFDLSYQPDLEYALPFEDPPGTWEDLPGSTRQDGLIWQFVAMLLVRMNSLGLNASSLLREIRDDVEHHVRLQPWNICHRWAYLGRGTWRLLPEPQRGFEGPHTTRSLSPGHSDDEAPLDLDPEEPAFVMPKHLRREPNWKRARTSQPDSMFFLRYDEHVGGRYKPKEGDKGYRQFHDPKSFDAWLPKAPPALAVTKAVDLRHSTSFQETEARLKAHTPSGLSEGSATSSSYRAGYLPIGQRPSGR